MAEQQTQRVNFQIIPEVLQSVSGILPAADLTGGAPGVHAGPAFAVNPLQTPDVGDLPYFITVGTVPDSLLSLLEEGFQQGVFNLLERNPIDSPSSYVERVLLDYAQQHFPPNDLLMSVSEVDGHFYLMMMPPRPQSVDFHPGYRRLEQLEPGFFAQMMLKLEGCMAWVQPFYGPFSAAQYLENCKWDGNYQLLFQHEKEAHAKHLNIPLEELTDQAFEPVFAEEHYLARDVHVEIPEVFFDYPKTVPGYFRKHLSHPHEEVRQLSRWMLDLLALQENLPEDAQVELEDEGITPFCQVVTLNPKKLSVSLIEEMYDEDITSYEESGMVRNHFVAFVLTVPTLVQYVGVASKMLRLYQDIERKMKDGNPDHPQ